ncbi:MAG TPA: ATP-binding SpoIIE family protein phosphatase [Nitrospira sp.]|nr:ATP-binding SpoIIE family protein phosphatase [Nitrospira sp.]
MALTTMPVQLAIPVTEQSQTAAARRTAVRLGQEAGLDEAGTANLALVVTELATNLLKHADRGELLMRRLGAEGKDGVEILSLDKGPGIPDVVRALCDGYSTAGSSGTGLGAVMRTASAFDLYSQPGEGTALVARLFAEPAKGWRSAQSVGIVRQAKAGEALSGDDWIVQTFAGGWLCAVADGLGHGPLAAAASASIMEALLDAHGKHAPVELVEAAHRAAKPTRGAAFGVAVKDEKMGMLRFAGIGNIAGMVLEGARRMPLISHNGILGHDDRKATEFSHPWSRDAVLVMHSDGIGSQWDLGRYPGLLSRDPSLIAAVLYRDFGRGRDDATVVVVKEC